MCFYTHSAKRVFTFCLLVLCINICCTWNDAHAQCKPQQIAKLLPEDGTAYQGLGLSVSVHEDIAIVGAPLDNVYGEYSGSAYIFEVIDGSWTQAAKLIPDVGEEDNWFGRSVSIYGDVAIIGADQANNNTGAAYVFERVDGKWLQAATLIASDGVSADIFGRSVSISNNTIIIGATGDHVGKYHGAGAVYIFENINNSWIETQKIIADDRTYDDYFGTSICISNEILVVGANGDEENGLFSGSAYVFEFIDGIWTQTAKLLANDGQESDNFGVSVSVSDNVIVIGASYEDHNKQDGTEGAAYVYEKLGNSWTQTSKLIADDGLGGDNFGVSVGVSHRNIIIGAMYTDDNGFSAGSAYLFKKVGGIWTQISEIIADDGAAEDQFGFDVGISSSTVIAGAPVDDSNGELSGAAYIFDINCEPGTIAALTDFSIDTGVLLDGALSDLESSDDSYIHTRSGFGQTLVDLHNMEMSILSEAIGLNPSTINLTIESRIDEPAGLAQIQMKNFNTNNFDTVGSYSIGNTDAVEQITGLDATKYYNSNNGRMRIKIKHLIFIPFLAFTFESYIDMVEITVE